MNRSLAFAFRVVFFYLLVSGCSTGAQLEVKRQDNILAEMQSTLKTCTSKISANPVYAPLRKKTPIDAGAPFTLEMISDNTRPSKHEISLLYKIHGDIQNCRQIVLDAASRAHPMKLVVFVEMFTAADKIYADAVNGKLTWAQINQGKKNVLAEGGMKMTQVETQLASGLQNQHNQEIQQRQQAAAAFQQWSQQQQAIQQQQRAINALNRPRTIDCDYYGNTARCTSR